MESLGEILRNEIMASCRKHFAEDQEAKELVALVEQHKLEVEQEKGKADLHVKSTCRSDAKPFPFSRILAYSYRILPSTA